MGEPETAQNLALGSASTGVPAAVPDLGPLVSRTWGDVVQIFQSSRLGLPGRVLVMTMFSMAIVALDELAGGPSSSALFWLVPTFLAFEPAIRRWRARRRFSRQPRLAQVEATGPSAVVRISGTVQPQSEWFLAPGTDRAVVYARTLFAEPGRRDRPGPTAREEIRGVPFRIRLDDGVMVGLRPDDLRLADEPSRVKEVAPEVLTALGAARLGYRLERGPRFFEATLAPGDRIEAIGRLISEVSVHGVGAPTRGSPLLHILLPPPNDAIWVRRLAA